MGGKSSRNKGSRGEREVIALLQPIVDEVYEELGRASVVLRRNADQRFAAKQYDIIGLPWLAVEVKRVENQSGLGSWWRQVLEATAPRQFPVLMYRANHQPWKVRTLVAIGVNARGTKGGDGVPKVRVKVDMSIDDWLFWFRLSLRYELTR